MRKKIIGIIGGHSHNTTAAALLMAERVGAEAARHGFAIVCGGFDGVMEAASKGCREAGGTTLAILKGNDRTKCNSYIDYPIVTSMDVACNNIVVWTSQALVAFDGRYGTLNEIALALDFGKPLVVVGKPHLLNVGSVDAKNFRYFEGYDDARVPAILDAVESLIEAG
ncbi:MAG: TIGR00725 family protein [bacterium]